MVRLAANLTLMFNEVDFLDRFAAAAAAGFKGVEYLFPYDYPAESIAEQLDKHGLEQVLFDFPAGDWDGGDRGLACIPDRVGEFQDSVGLALNYAKVLGCTRLTCLAGIAPDSVDPATIEQTMVDNLKFAATAAADSGVTVLVEPLNTRDVAGTYVYTSSHGRSLVESAASPIVKLQYDVYHMQIMEGDLAPTIDANMDVIHHFQLADNPGRNEPGTGEINYDYLLPHIDGLGYEGWIGCEYRRPVGPKMGSAGPGSTSSRIRGAVPGFSAAQMAAGNDPEQ